MPNLHGQERESIPDIPAAPVAAFIVGFAVYFACAKVGLISPGGSDAEPGGRRS